MYGEERPLQRLNRILSWSFPLGRPFGIELRVYGAIVIVPLTAVLDLVKFTGISGIEVAAIAAIITLTLYTVVWTHEMGHAWMGRRHRIPTHRITLSPLGGLAHMQAAAPGPKAEILISVAGPAVHLVWLAVFWPLSLLLEGGGSPPDGWLFDPLRFTVSTLVTMNVGLLLFNLLPFYPLDGGRVFRSLLALRLHPNRASLWAANVGLVGAVGFMAYGFASSGFRGGILFAIGFVSFFQCLQERVIARHGDGPYGPSRDPWEMDPDAWRYGGGASDDRGGRARGPGFFARWKSRFARKPRPIAPPAIAPDDAELDRLLEKVGSVGISALTTSERAALLRASESRRR